MGGRHDDDTLEFTPLGAGNDLYHRAMFAIGLHSTAVSSVLRDTLRAINSSPMDLTIDELAAMLPEVERRLRLLAPHDEATNCMARLMRLVMEWES